MSCGEKNELSCSSRQEEHALRLTVYFPPLD